MESFVTTVLNDVARINYGWIVLYEQHIMLTLLVLIFCAGLFSLVPYRLHYQHTSLKACAVLCRKTIVINSMIFMFFLQMILGYSPILFKFQF